MIVYSSSYLDFDIQCDRMDEIEQKVFPDLQEKYGRCEIYIPPGRDGWLFTNNNLVSIEEAVDFYASFLEEYNVMFQKIGVEEINYFITFAMPQQEDCSLVFTNLARLLKYIDHFCLETYQPDTSNEGQPTKINGNKNRYGLGSIEPVYVFNSKPNKIKDTATMTLPRLSLSI